ncbi:Basic-leucine zipper domain [Arabidopsis suecica]|uniref:Basic-leucine zipper domain n=1 Tax=Arabidopsis suecica TaxID=45249 RepID=A0A8T2BRL4_ARASU|nr:Basic-leucine zipper domain [Arabidopsis suecica]
MASSKGSQSVRNLMYPGKHALLPPKIPFPSVSASYSEYIPSGLIGSRHGQKLSGEKTHHQRTSSESHLVEELPFWLDDLLNEPDSPARKCGHRRSSSDSYAYLDVANVTNISLTLQNDFSYRNTVSSTQRGIQELDRNKNVQDAAFYSDANFLKQKSRQRDSLVANGARPSWLPYTRESGGGKNMGPLYMSQDATVISERKNYAEPLSHDPKMFSSEENNSNPPPVTYEADNTKRAKQQFAQRSRVRKLQYISELERNVQTLQAEGSKVSAELDFLNQRNLILSMENKALKQRLESIAQEKLIKQLEQELLEKEIGRLRTLYQQQQQTQKPSASRGRATSKDLDSQFSSLSLNTKDSNCRRDSVSVMGQFHF